MKDIVRNLTKQKQLLEIELGGFALNKKAGLPSIHPESYYAKLAHAWKGIRLAIRMLSRTNRDIYSDFDHLKQ